MGVKANVAIDEKDSIAISDSKEVMASEIDNLKKLS